MKQIIEEYWQFDGSIKECINIFLKDNKNYRVGDVKISNTESHGIYALVVYEYVGGYIKGYSLHSG